MREAEEKLEKKKEEVKQALEKLQAEEKALGQEVLKLHGIGRKIRLKPEYDEDRKELVGFDSAMCYVYEG